MRKLFRRWTRGIRWGIYYQKRIWPLRREAWRRCREGLTYDPAIPPRLMLFVVISTSIRLLAYLAGDSIPKKSPSVYLILLAGYAVMFYLAHALGVRGWHHYPAYLADVLNEESERMEAENRAWYLSELFGDGSPPQSVIDRHGEPPGMKEGHQDGSPDESGIKRV